MKSASKCDACAALRGPRSAARCSARSACRSADAHGQVSRLTWPEAAGTASAQSAPACAAAAREPAGARATPSAPPSASVVASSVLRCPPDRRRPMRREPAPARASACASCRSLSLPLPLQGRHRLCCSASLLEAPPPDELSASSTAGAAGVTRTAFTRSNAEAVTAAA